MSSEPNAPAAPPPFRPHPPVVIGILGGIAAGKSAVAAAFAARGLVHVDADRIARAVTEEPEVRKAVGLALGPAVLDAEGRLDRQAVAKRIFADAGAREQLEAITHPRIRRTILAELERARQGSASVLLDVPLLLERGLVEQCDHLVFVHASDAVRAARAAARGWTPGELQQREAAQASLTKKRSRADFAVDNDGALDALPAQVDEVLRRLQGATP